MTELPSLRRFQTEPSWPARSVDGLHGAPRQPTASAAAPSPRPTKPIPSPVVALTFTCPGAIPSAVANRARIASRYGPSFGCSSITVASTCTIASPGATQLRDRRAQQVDRVGVAVALVGVGEVLADVAEAGGAQQRVDDRVGEDVGVGVTREPRVVGISTPPRISGRPSAKRWVS